MNFLIASHFWIAILLVLTVLAGVFSKTEKRVKWWLMWSRLLYMVMIITGFIAATKTWSTVPILTILKGTLAILLIGIVEIVFARKQETHVTPWLYVVLGLLFAATIILGYTIYSLTA